MKKSEEKQDFVKELSLLQEEMNMNRLYAFPNQEDTQEWISNVRAILKNLDENDYQEFVSLSKTVGLSPIREKRKKAAKEINQFLKGKVAEYKRYDFSTKEKPIDRVGILNEGKNNTFIGNIIAGHDVGIRDKGSGTYASGNIASGRPSSNRVWYEKLWGRILIGVVTGVVIAGIVYILKWN